MLKITIKKFYGVMLDMGGRGAGWKMKLIIMILGNNYFWIMAM